MDRRIGLVAAIGLMVLFVAVFAAGGGDDAPSLDAASVSSSEPSVGTATTATAGPVSTLTPEERAVAVVEEYWAHVSADASRVASVLDLPAAETVSELGLAEYMGALGGRYEAECEPVVTVGDEIVVDCTVELFEDALAVAFGIGATPTQFRVRDGKISRVGYLKPYSTVDLALAAHAARVDPDGLASACADPGSEYQSEAGVVYRASCGVFMAQLTATLLEDLRSRGVCDEDCNEALLSSIRPARD